MTKSIVARRNLTAGVRLTADDLAVKKPGTGILAADIAGIIGRTLRRQLARDELLSPEDVE